MQERRTNAPKALIDDGDRYASNQMLLHDLAFAGKLEVAKLLKSFRNVNFMQRTLMAKTLLIVKRSVTSASKSRVKNTNLIAGLTLDSPPPR